MLDNFENNENLFDIDFEAKEVESTENSMITSYSLCTPGCGNSGSFNSFCC